MPIAILVLALGTFTQGSSELMFAGLLPDLSRDLRVSIPRAGDLITAFAIGMMVGAPGLALATVSMPRKQLLVILIGAFSAMHFVAALAPEFTLLLITRFASGVAFAGFLATAVGTAAHLADPSRQGRAVGIVTAGFAAATAIGLPAGTAIGQALGWRGAVLGVGAMAGVGMILTLLLVPNSDPRAASTAGRELRALRNPQLMLSYVVTALSMGALMCTFSYLGALLPSAPGFSPVVVPWVLALFGFGALLGIFVGGMAADRWPWTGLLTAFAGLAVASMLLHWGLNSAPAMATLLVAFGFCGYLSNPILNSRVLRIAPGAQRLAPALAATSFNVGISGGTWAGGLLLDHGHGYAILPVLSTVLASLALLLIGADPLTEQHSRRTRGIRHSLR